MKLTITDGVAVLSECSMVDLALLRVGSERGAITTARRLYKLDQAQARLLVLTARDGTPSEAPREPRQYGSGPGGSRPRGGT